MLLAKLEAKLMADLDMVRALLVEHQLPLSGSPTAPVAVLSPR
jgi:hypothetical protein